MTIDNYIFFSKNIKNEMIEKVISKINDRKDCELVLTNGPILGEIVNECSIEFNFDFRYKGSETSKIIIGMSYKDEENTLDDIIQDEEKSVITSIKNKVNCDSFSKVISIFVVPKDDLSYILFQLITAEIAKSVEGLAMCYLYDNTEDEKIEFFYFEDIEKKIKENINEIFTEKLTVDNSNCAKLEQAKWNETLEESKQARSNSYDPVAFSFKVPIIYTAVSVVIFILIMIMMMKYNYFTDAPKYLQMLSKISIYLLAGNVVVYPVTYVVCIIKHKIKK